MQIQEPFLEYLSERFDLEKILFLDDDYYEDALKPIIYNYIKSYRYLRRNAAIAMGNSADSRYIPALQRAVSDSDELIADAARWALIQLQK